MQTITGKEIKFLPEIIFDNVNGKLDGNEPFTIEFKNTKDYPNTATKLSVYVDFSVPLFFSEYFKNLIYDEINKAIIAKFWKDCSLEFNMEKKDYDYEHKHYIFYDDIDMKIEYHREINKYNGEEIEYMRLYIMIYLIILTKDKCQK